MPYPVPRILVRCRSVHERAISLYCTLLDEDLGQTPVCTVHERAISLYNTG